MRLVRLPRGRQHVTGGRRTEDCVPGHVIQLRLVVHAAEKLLEGRVHEVAESHGEIVTRVDLRVRGRKGHRCQLSVGPGRLGVVWNSFTAEPLGRAGAHDE